MYSKGKNFVKSLWNVSLSLANVCVCVFLIMLYVYLMHKLCLREAEKNRNLRRNEIGNGMEPIKALRSDRIILVQSLIAINCDYNC